MIFLLRVVIVISFLWLRQLVVTTDCGGPFASWPSLAIRRSRFGPLSAALGVRANALVHRGPAFFHLRLVIVGNKAECGVLECD
jgi:hypothetical protein